MALDPQAQAVIDLVIKSGRPAYNTLSPKDARQLFRETRPASTPTPPEIGAVRNLVAQGPGGPIPLRVYRPAGVAASVALPGLMYFHGGGWVIGDLDTHDVLCRQLTAEAGVTVVNVDYRLAPEHRFPAAVEDSLAATEWVSANAAPLGADRGRLAVAGDSAGGNLSAVVSLRARGSGGPPIAFQLLVYPATDLTRSAASHKENGEGYLLTNELMAWFMAHYFGGEGDLRHPDASPLFVEDLSGLPPALVITAEFDPLRDEGEAYAERLRRAGVDARASRYDGMIHGFFGLDAVFDAARKAMDEAVMALQEALA